MFEFPGKTGVIVNIMVYPLCFLEKKGGRITLKYLSSTFHFLTLGPTIAPLSYDSQCAIFKYPKLIGPKIYW